LKGFFKPKHPEKYKGDPTNIIYRSSYELKFMLYLDSHPEIIEWSSEELAIPYRSPIDNRIHRYFVDFIITKISNGKKETVAVEIKPSYQTKEPTKGKSKRVTKKYINEVKTWGVNQAKWKAAREYCADRKWSFTILTELELFNKNG
jgi:hypothetical protein